MNTHFLYGANQSDPHFTDQTHNEPMCDGPTHIEIPKYS